MKPGQELVILFLLLFIGVVAIIIILSVVLNRLPKQKQHSHSIKHSTLYSVLPDIVGGQILIHYGVAYEKTGIIDDIKLNTENDRLDLNFSCSWTAKRENGNSRWLPYNFENEKHYYNLFKEGTLFEIDKASIFKIKNDGFCIVMHNAQGVVFIYPKGGDVIKLEDIEGFEAMLPITTKKVTKV